MAKEHFLGRAKVAKVGRLSANPKMTSVHSVSFCLFVTKPYVDISEADLWKKNVICPTLIQAAHIGPVLSFSNKTFSLEHNFLSEDRTTAHSN